MAWPSLLTILKADPLSTTLAGAIFAQSTPSAVADSAQDDIAGLREVSGRDVIDPGERGEG